MTIGSPAGRYVAAKVGLAAARRALGTPNSERDVRAEVLSLAKSRGWRAFQALDSASALCLVRPPRFVVVELASGWDEIEAVLR